MADHLAVLEQRRVQFSNRAKTIQVVRCEARFSLPFESFLRISPETRIVAMVNGNSPNELFCQGMRRNCSLLASSRNPIVR